MLFLSCIAMGGAGFEKRQGQSTETARKHRETKAFMYWTALFLLVVSVTCYFSFCFVTYDALQSKKWKTCESGSDFVYSWFVSILVLAQTGLWFFNRLHVMSLEA